MPQYSCLTCNYSTKIKSHYERHLNTNKHKKFKIEAEKNSHQLTSFNINSHHLTSFNITDENQKKKENKYVKVCCKYCKTSVLQNNLRRHYRNSCLNIPIKEKKQIIDKYNNHKKSNKVLTISNNYEKTIISNNTTNNNISNNTMNNTMNNSININLNAFGKENINKITEKQILKILNKAYSSFPLLLKQLHFNVKENRNIYQPNLNKPFIKYYNGEGWQSDKFDSISQKIFNNVSNLLEDWLEEYQTKIHEKKQNILNHFIDDCNGGKTENKFNEELKMFFMDYSNEIKEQIVNKIKNSNLIE